MRLKLAEGGTLILEEEKATNGATPLRITDDMIDTFEGCLMRGKYLIGPDTGYLYRPGKRCD